MMPNRPGKCASDLRSSAVDSIEQAVTDSGAALRWHNVRFTRRQVLRTAYSAGVGVVGLALVGCGEDDVDEPRSTPSSQSAEPQQTDTQQSVVSQRTDSPAVTQEEVDQSQPAEPPNQEQPQPDQSQTNDGVSAQTSQSVQVAEDLVDPLEWREQYHWRKLAELHDRPRAPVGGGTLTIESAALANWDPLAGWESDSTIAQPGHLLPLVYSRLVDLDISDRSDAHRTLIQGDLASGWELPDATAIVFSLRADMNWPDGSISEGRLLDANDVALSYNTLREPGRRQAPIYDAVERIETNGDAAGGSVTFRLREPHAPLLNQMTSPWHVVLPAEIVSGSQNADLSQRTIGSGPFQLKLSDGRSNWVLTRNPTYGRTDADGLALPYLDEVRGEDYLFRDQVGNTTSGGSGWAAWESGAAQAIALDGPADARRALQSQPDAQLQVTPPIPSGGGHFTFASLSDGAFADVRVRTALSMALHRGNLAALAHGGFAAPDTAQNWTFFRDFQQPPDGLREWPWNEDELGDSQRYEPNQALALLSAAGYSEENPLPLGVDMPPALNPAGTPYDPFAHGIAEFVAEQWEQYLFGAVDVRRLERIWTQFIDSQGGVWFVPEPDPAVDLIFQDPIEMEIYDADADDLAYGAMHSAGRFNHAGINDSEIDEWAVAQRQALDPLERADQLERIRMKEQEQVWRILLVNPYGVRVRREGVFNLLDTYYAKTLDRAPDQLKRVWIEQ